LDTAIALLSDFVEREPNDVSGCNALARAFVAAGRFDDAEPLFTRVSKLHELRNTEEKVRARLAAKAHELNDAWDEGRYQDCEAMIHEMLPETGGVVKSHLLLKLAEVYSAMGREDDARKARGDAAVARSQAKGVQ
jgi:hypothetical protein